MKCDSILIRKIFLKLMQDKPYLSVCMANELLNRVLNCNDILSVNINEWVENKPVFSDIWINDKYCVNAVMEIRKDNDALSAILALDDYITDVSKEYALWKPRA